MGLLNAQRMLLMRVVLSWLRDKRKDRGTDSVLTSII